MSGTVTEQAGRYYVSIVCKVEETTSGKLINDPLGIDLGLKDFAILSNGIKKKNINKTSTVKKLEKRLKREQKRLSRKYECLNKQNREKGEAKKQKLSKVALLGTKYTMTQAFYKQKLVDHGIDVLIPNEQDVEFVNDVIYQELCLGIINPKSKENYLAIINKLQQEGAEGVILGCTEVGLLISQEDTSLPVFDTAVIHAVEAARFAVSPYLGGME